MDVKICTIEDAPALRALAEKTYRDTFEQHNTKADMDAYVAERLSLSRMEEELSNRHSVFLFAMQDGQPTGYLKCNYAPAQTELQDAASLEVERIYILREQQGKGTGQWLLDRAVELARRGNLQYIWLGVWEHNHSAIRFYEKNGFYRFGEHIFQLGDDKQLDWLLRKDL